MKKNQIKTEKDVAQALSDKTQFEREVLIATFRIPKGKISTYKRIAQKIGRPKAHRAVANALHKNTLWPIVPCHRVIRSDGSFGGPKRAADRRRRSVEQEGIPTKENKVKIDHDILW